MTPPTPAPITASCIPAVLLATLMVAALGVGCKHKKGATCDAAGARFLALARQDLDASADLDAASKRGLVGLLAPMRDAMVRACRRTAGRGQARIHEILDTLMSTFGQQ